MLSMDAAGSLILPRSHGITVEEEEEEDELGCMSSDSSQSNFSSSSASSLEDMNDDATSQTTSPAEGGKPRGPLYGMSSLAAELPIKRGLSKYYDGKCRTFASLSNVQCLEDLAKPERRPFRRKLKPCKSYGGGLDSSHHKPLLSPSGSSRAIAKKASGSSLASSSSIAGAARRHHGFISGRPPVHPHRSNHFCGAQTLLFA